MNLGHGGPRLRGASPGENFTRKENGDNSEEITSGVLLRLKINRTPNDPENDGKFITSLLRRAPQSNSGPEIAAAAAATRDTDGGGDSEWKCHSSPQHPLLLFLICSNSRSQCGVLKWGWGGGHVKGVQAGLSQHLGARAPLIGILSVSYGGDAKGAVFRRSDAAKSRRL